MLLSPPAEDWLMYSRTYDAQRFSPLDQINRENVSRLQMAWTRGMSSGAPEGIPIVYGGTMYLVNSSGVVAALDATNGEPIWEYVRKLPEEQGQGAAIFNTLAISEDLLFYAAPDGRLVALEAATGKLRWETPPASGRYASGPLAVGGKLIIGHNGNESRADCFIAAYDAQTGKELWKFYTTAGPGESGGDSWGALAVDKRIASVAGLPGTYDPVRKLVYWGVASPKPSSRMDRHGAADATAKSSPSELYGDSTVALDPETGKLAWYYQHIPGNDWGNDSSYERMLVRTPMNPDPRFVRWTNPEIARGQAADVLLALGEPGGMWALDRATGKFLWATPFPRRLPEFFLRKIDARTGQIYLNEDLISKQAADRHIVCYFNTRSPWPPAYNPATNYLYVPYIESCQDITQGGKRLSVPLPGSEQAGANRSLRELSILEQPISFTGMAKVNLATGEVSRIDTGPAPGNGAVLATAGNLMFWGDLNRRFRAFDAATGELVWESILGGTISVSAITYAAKGRQFVAVMTGDTAAAPALLQKAPQFKPPLGHKAIYAFALP
jgi:alcohol dehydrogenase (cytochrome c)